MPRTVITTAYICNECGFAYESLHRATFCETDPVQSKPPVQAVGDKFVNAWSVSKVVGAFPEMVRTDLTRNLNKVQIWSVVRISHNTSRIKDRFYRSPAYIMTNGVEEIRISSRQLDQNYYQLAEGQKDKIVRDVLGLYTAKKRKTCPPERLARAEEVVDELIARATTMETNDPTQL